MRAAWLLVLCACGVPEQLLRVRARVLESTGRLEQKIPVTLESDDGSNSEGCGTFAALQRLEIPARSSATFEVLRAETIGPSGEPRCFRLNWQNRSLLAFGPLAHDVGLPGFWVWPAGTDVNTVAMRTGTGMQFYTTPNNYLGMAEDHYDLFPPRHFVEVFDDRGQLAWRLFQGDSTGAMTVSFSTATAIVNGYMLEGRSGVMRGGSFRAGRTYVTDSVGRPHEMLYEHRIITNELQVFGSGEFVPVSRGDRCEGFDPCPFTDGDFTPVKVGAPQVDLDLDGDLEITRMLVRGLWAGPATAFLRVDYTDERNKLNRIQVPLGDKERNENRNGGYGPGRVDLTIFTGTELGGRKMRRAVLSVVDAQNEPVIIDRLAEISFFP